MANIHGLGDIRARDERE